MTFLLSKMGPLNLNSISSFSPSNLRHTQARSFLFTLLSSFSSISKTPNLLFANFLIDTLDFSKTQALNVASASRQTNIKSLEKPKAVVQYFQNLGFTEKQIQSSVHLCPQILFSDIDKTLKPKIEYFQQLGLPSSHLGKFISKTPRILAHSLEKKLVPTVEVFRKILVNDRNNEGLFKVLNRSNWLNYNNNTKLLPNIRFLESCGIVGSQLALLLKTRTRLFGMREAAIRKLVSKVSDLGFKMNSRMFAHGLLAVSCYSVETFERKVQSFERFGFSKDEFMEMFRKTPMLLNTSTKKSMIGLDFYLNTVKLRKEVIITDPTILTYSMENRVRPRYTVLQIVKSKHLLKKEPSFRKALKLGEEVFMKRFISKFTDHKEELLKAYKGHTLDSSP